MIYHWLSHYVYELLITWTWHHHRPYWTACSDFVGCVGFFRPINPSDCVDMNCDGLKKLLVVDSDGSFLGEAGFALPNSGEQWDADPAFGVGDYRIPKVGLSCWGCVAAPGFCSQCELFFTVSLMSYCCTRVLLSVWTVLHCQMNVLLLHPCSALSVNRSSLSAECLIAASVFCSQCEPFFTVSWMSYPPTSCCFGEILW